MDQTSPFHFFFKIAEFLSCVQHVCMSEFNLGDDGVDQEDSSCNWCGASISETDNECPTCGKAIARKLVRKQLERSGYSGVFQQQGRMITDADWNESPRITKQREIITSVRCPSCRAVHKTKVRICNKCGASF